MMGIQTNPLRFPLILLWLGAVLATTMTPVVVHTVPADGPSWAQCGLFETADFALNVLMFLPGGFLLGTFLTSRRTIGVLVAVTVAIECLQLTIPGRCPALQDVVANLLGASIGFAVARRGRGCFRRMLSVLAVTAWLAPLLLASRLEPRGPFHALWTAQREGVQYGGRLLEASVGTVSLPNGPVADGPGLADELRQGGSLSLVVEAGPPPARFVRLIEIVVDGTTPVYTVGLLESDILFRGITIGTRLGFHQPYTRWRRGMAGVQPGDTVFLHASPSDRSTCMSVGSEQRCGLAPGLGQGWGVWLDLRDAPPGLFWALGVIWSLGVGATLGVAVGSIQRSVLLAGIVAVLGTLATLATESVSPDLLASMLLIVGALLGSFVAGGPGSASTGGKAVRSGRDSIEGEA